MTQYPTHYFSPRVVEDRNGVEYDADKTKVFFAKDHNDLANELVAVMGTLGLSPQGDYTTVGDRLDDIEAQISGLSSTGGWEDLDTIPTLIDSADPCYTLRFAADMTDILQNGQRIKITQNGADKFFIIHSVGAYGGGNTDVIVFGGTDYDVQNTSTYPIKNPQYSCQYAPFGFNPLPSKWSISGGSSSSQANPIVGTWYNLGGSVVLGVGSWIVKAKILMYYRDESNAGANLVQYASLSNTDDTEGYSDTLVQNGSEDDGASGRQRSYNSSYIEKELSFSSETEIFINTKAVTVSFADISLNCKINAVSAFL